MGKKAKGFFTPFAHLDQVFAKQPSKSPAARASAPPPPEPPRSAPAEPTSDVINEDEQAFADEMSGVRPLPEDARGYARAPIHSVQPTRPSRRHDEAAEVSAALADLVDGAGSFDIADTDEYMEGLGPGVDRRLLRKLRRGEFAVQAHLDLHGLTSDEARVEVERFIDEARASHRRSLLIIHGRGLNSKEGVAVLKERLKVWLSRGRVGRGVLAFCTARPADGGAGAVYVLLRKNA